jgi:hypothetical protein
MMAVNIYKSLPSINCSTFRYSGTFRKFYTVNDVAVDPTW